MNKVILWYSDGMRWSRFEVFDDMQQLLKKFQDEYDMPELTIEEIQTWVGNSSWQDENDMKISFGTNN